MSEKNLFMLIWFPLSVLFFPDLRCQLIDHFLLFSSRTLCSEWREVSWNCNLWLDSGIWGWGGGRDTTSGSQRERISLPAEPWAAMSSRRRIAREASVPRWGSLLPNVEMWDFRHLPTWFLWAASRRRIRGAGEAEASSVFWETLDEVEKLCLTHSGEALL